MFKTFPEFTKLTLNDREEYESFTRDFPPVGDISFSVLLVWWDTLGTAAVARLNDNLVISYWTPGDDEHSGLSLVGTKQVDESVETIFEYLRGRGEKPRLVNVPDFVVNSMRQPEMFSFGASSGDDEYIVSVAKYASIDGLPHYMRPRVRKFIRENDPKNIRVKHVDLHSFVNRQILLEASGQWPSRGVNNMTKFGRQLLPVAVAKAPYLGIKCLGLYLEKELQAYCLYTHASTHVALLSVRVNYNVPRIFDYMIHAFAEHLAAMDVAYANLYSDSGSPAMRIVKIGLRPDNFFRKYVIEPA